MSLYLLCSRAPRTDQREQPRIDAEPIVPDPENALCALIHTINSFQASNALDHYHREKALVEIRREASRKKRLINRKK